MFLPCCYTELLELAKHLLPYAIAGSSKLPFFALNATHAGKKDVEANRSWMHV